MNEERIKVLKMLEVGRITIDEAAKLIEAIERTTPVAIAQAAPRAITLEQAAVDEQMAALDEELAAIDEQLVALDMAQAAKDKAQAEKDRIIS